MLQGGDIQEGLMTSLNVTVLSSINMQIPNITVDNPDIIRKVQDSIEVLHLYRMCCVMSV